MLKYRLIFGTLIAIAFTTLIILDGWMDGSLTASTPDKPVQGTIFFILIAMLIIPAQLELSKLAAAKNLKIFIPVTIIASILFAGTWYWPQLLNISPEIYLSFLSVFVLLALFLYQYLSCGTSAVLANCGVNYFVIGYLGLLSSFCIAIRIDFGPWHLLMFASVIKFADIGAYAIGSVFGKHKFAPNISPGKTWEGMAGAVAAAIIVAFIFSHFCGIMPWPAAVIFGLCFAFIGQLGDLAESMIKRDAQQKDSTNPDSFGIPGFGGILDVIDSPLVAAPFAYLFFMCGF